MTAAAGPERTLLEAIRVLHRRGVQGVTAMPYVYATGHWRCQISVDGDEVVGYSYDLNQYYARCYDPSTGTWASQDAWRGLLAQPQSLHRYAYVLNSPARFADVGGYRPYDPPWVGTKYTKAGGWEYSKIPEQHGTVQASPPKPKQKDSGASPTPADRANGGCGYSYNPCTKSKYTTKRHAPTATSTTPPPCGTGSYDACGAEGPTGQVACATAGAAAVVAGTAVMTCTAHLGKGSTAATAGVTFTFGQALKAGGSVGAGFGYTNARTAEEFASITWSANIEVVYGVGGAFLVGTGTSASGKRIWMYLLTANAGSSVGASAGGGPSCTVGVTC